MDEMHDDMMGPHHIGFDRPGLEDDDTLPIGGGLHHPWGSGSSQTQKVTHTVIQSETKSDGFHSETTTRTTVTIKITGTGGTQFVSWLKENGYSGNPIQSTDGTTDYQVSNPDGKPLSESQEASVRKAASEFGGDSKTGAQNGGKSESGTNWLIIGGAIAAVVLLGLIIIVVVVCAKRRR